MTTLLAPPALFQLAPPYDQFEAVPEFAGHALPALPDAAVLAVAVSSPPEPWEDLAGRVARLRTDCPAAPVVLRVGERVEEGRTTGRATRRWLGARACCSRGSRCARPLRRALTDADRRCRPRSRLVRAPRAGACRPRSGS